jgi:hypothetical protein
MRGVDLMSLIKMLNTIRNTLTKTFTFAIIISLTAGITPVFAQDDSFYSDDSEEEITTEVTEEKSEIDQIKDEIASIKNDVQKLKDRSEWFDFTFDGDATVTWGASIWATEATPVTSPVLNTTPVSQGFDFENNFRFNIDLGKKIVASNLQTSEYGTEVDIKLKIDSFGLDKMKPKGSWYILDATDDIGNPVQLYFPRVDAGSSNVFLGNMQLAIEEASVKKILGTGMFISYKDVTEVHHYYGVEGIAEIMSLNYDYFNNGYITDVSDDSSYASLYFSFDPEFYEPENMVSEAVQFWTNDMLYTRSSAYGNNPYNYNNDASRFNQQPHGISLGFDKQLTEGFYLFVEGGAASKDAFDPRYYTDNAIDYGFFVRGGPKFFKKDSFSLHPQIAVSFAFQTDVTADVREQYSTLGVAATVPFKFNLPTARTDYINLAVNWNLNVKVLTGNVATMISFLPEAVLFNNRFKISMPLVYSFKNGSGGFLSFGREDSIRIDQVDSHMFFFGLIASFDSRSLFGNMFRYKVTNKLYVNVNHQFTENSTPEIYFYEIMQNEFLINNTGAERFAFFLNLGVGYAANARLIYSQYSFDVENNVWMDTQAGQPVDWNAATTSWGADTRWAGGAVLDLSLGFEVDVIKNWTIGFAAESPKILTMTANPIGNQQNFGTFKLWTRISL